jgi:hypothetical protein
MLPKAPADWLALAAAILFATLSFSLLLNSETAVLKLAVLGWPTWLAFATGVIQLAGALSLLVVRLRTPAALLLAALGCGQLISNFLYRDFQALSESALQITLLVLILVLENRRREGSGKGGNQDSASG